MNKYGKFAALIVVVIGTLVWLATAEMKENQTYYKTITELGAMGNRAYNARIRVGGDVEEVLPGLEHIDATAANIHTMEQIREQAQLVLTRALQYAGARSIVASQWSVETYSTTDLMIEFYRLYAKEKRARADALADRTHARAMIERIKGFPLLAGARGEKPVDLPFLEESLLRLSQLVGDLEDDLAELDFNPLIVTGDRNNSFVVDARIALMTKS
jgi:hypothetical protein